MRMGRERRRKWSRFVGWDGIELDGMGMAENLDGGNEVRYGQASRKRGKGGVSMKFLRF